MLTALAAALAPLAAVAAILPAATSLLPLLASTPHVRIAFSTRDLAGARFWLVFAYLVASSAVRRLGFGSPPVASDGDAHVLPRPVSLSMPLRIAPADLAQYTRASGGDPLAPAHLILFLSAATEPAMLLLLARRISPLDPVGTVNVRNRFEVVDDSCAAAVRAGGALEVVARIARDVARVKRGWEIDLVVELVSDRTLYRQTFTMLQFHKHRSPPDARPAPSSATPTSASFRLAASDPWLWAALSRDHNPIHTSRLAARALGFRTKIAHGNHVAARAVAAAGGGAARWMTVELRRPVFVPAELDVGRGVVDGVTELDVRAGGKDVVGVRYGV